MKRTFVYYNLVVIMIVMSLFLGVTLTLSNYVNQQQTSNMLAIILDDTITTYNDASVTDQAFVTTHKNSDKRISILDSSGEPLADSMLLSVGGNQASYPEIQNLGTAYKRYSESLKMNLMYIAGIADNGNYIRVAVVMDEQLALNNQIIWLLVFITLLVILFAYFALKKTSQILFMPIKDLSNAVKTIKDGHYDWVLPATDYDEVNDLLREINGVNEQIVAQIKNLEAQEEELSILLENMQQGICLIADDESVVLSNELSQRWLHIDKDKPIYAIREKQIYDAIKMALNEKSNLTINHSVDGQEIKTIIKSVSHNVLKRDKHAYGVLVISIDETARIELEKNKRDFFANAQHELRTPLTAIKGAAELMLYDMATKDEKQSLTSDIIKQIGLMDNLLKDMLELSRLETKPKSNQQTIDLDQLLKQTLDQLSTFIHQKNIEVKLSSESIPYLCEASDIRSLFKNLIENAIKYNKNDGRIDINLKEDETHIIFVIKDSGIGIPKHQQPRIFERFYQVDKTRSKIMNGTGLGLAIVKHVVSHYDGTIDLESEPNQGSTFVIRLKK